MRLSRGIRPLAPVSGNRRAVVSEKRQWTAAGDAPDAIRFPAADNRVEPGRHAAEELSSVTNGNVVDVAKLEDGGNVERGQAALKLRLVRVLQAGEAAQPCGVVVGHRGVVNRLRPHVSGEELESVRVALLGHQLERM